MEIKQEFKKLHSELVKLNKRLGSTVTKEDAKRFATKDDLKNFSTKDDLKQFATKDDLKNFSTKDDLKQFATKDDLKNFATKDDLKNFATKDDLKAQTEELKEFAEEQTDKLAQVIAETIDKPLTKHLKDVSLDGDLSMRVLHLEKDVRQIKKTIHA